MLKLVSVLIIFCMQFNLICFAADDILSSGISAFQGDTISSDKKIPDTDVLESCTNNTDKKINTVKLQAQISINRSNSEIKDFLAENYLDKNIKIPENIFTPIQDSLLNYDFIEKYSALHFEKPVNTPIYDDFAIENLASFKDVVYKKKVYDFENLNHIIIKIKAKEYISTKYLKEEGQSVDFVAVEDVIHNGKIIIPQNSLIKARIETISPNMSRGIPADLVIGHFHYKNIDLDGEISRTGANRVYWVVPVAFIANSLFLGTGYILWAIRGGHAKVKTNQIFEITLPQELY